MSPIRLLIVDDSLLMHKVLSDLVQTDKQIQVVGVARDGEEALLKVASLHPDVVTMDIEMPKMNGLTAVRRIMEANPTPVIMVSSLTQREALITLKALEFGAVDYVPKPSGQISLNMDSVLEELVTKVKTAAAANISQNKQSTAPEEDTAPTEFNGDHIISIAASTGGPPAVTKVLTSLPADSPPMLITQHMPKGVTKLFAEGLNERCKFTVKEAQEGNQIQARLALVAPGGYHMVVTKEHKIHLTTDPPVNYVRPAADVMMFSMAEVYGAKNVGVVLTGMGSDGAKGLKAIKESGGYTIAQDQATSVVYGMPNVAYQTGCVDKVVALDHIHRAIIKACT